MLQVVEQMALSRGTEPFTPQPAVPTMATLAAADPLDPRIGVAWSTFVCTLLCPGINAEQRQTLHGVIKSYARERKGKERKEKKLGQLFILYPPPFFFLFFFFFFFFF